MVCYQDLVWRIGLGLYGPNGTKSLALRTGISQAALAEWPDSRISSVEWETLRELLHVKHDEIQELLREIPEIGSETPNFSEFPEMPVFQFKYAGRHKASVSNGRKASVFSVKGNTS